MVFALMHSKQILDFKQSVTMLATRMHIMKPWWCCVRLREHLKVMLILPNMPVNGSASNNLSEEYYLLTLLPSIPLKVNPRFGGTYRLPLQGWIRRARYQRESRWQAGILLGLSDLEDGGDMLLRNIGWPSTVLFITTAVRTSNPTIISLVPDVILMEIDYLEKLLEICI
jgi:hypothetical protein